MAGAARPGRIHWRYVLLGLGLAGLAVLRLNGGSPGWTVVFGLAALCNAYLSVRPVLPPRFGGEAQSRVWQAETSATLAEPAPEELRRALEDYEPRMKNWLVIAVAAWVSTVAITLLTPPLGLAGAALFVLAAYRYLRCRRSVRILRSALSAPARDEVARNTDDSRGRPSQRSY